MELLNERSKKLADAVASAVAKAMGRDEIAVYPMQTGGGVVVLVVDFDQSLTTQTRQIWLTRDGLANHVTGTVGWLCGFYQFADDVQDEGVVVELLVRKPDDPDEIAATVAGIVKRMGIGLYDGPGS